MYEAALVGPVPLPELKEQEECLCYSCILPSVLGCGQDGLQSVVRLFASSRTDYSREAEDWAEFRRL